MKTFEQIDQAIFDLLLQRFDLATDQATDVTSTASGAAAATERTLQLQALDAKIEQLEKDNPELAPRIHKIFTEIVAECRECVKPLTVAYLGPEGTFTQSAALKFFGTSTNTFACRDIDDVFHSVESEQCQLGIVPIENSV